MIPVNKLVPPCVLGTYSYNPDLCLLPVEGNNESLTFIIGAQFLLIVEVHDLYPKFGQCLTGYCHCRLPTGGCFLQTVEAFHPLPLR